MWGNSISLRSLLYNESICGAGQCSINMLVIATVIVLIIALKNTLKLLLMLILQYKNLLSGAGGA